MGYGAERLDPSYILVETGAAVVDSQRDAIVLRWIKGALPANSLL
jgi:hypothetical protein